MTTEFRAKPDFETALRRIEAWFCHEILDRPPIRFTAHNAEYAADRAANGRRWPDLKSRWFDAEYQVDSYLRSIARRTFHAETFPVFWPNLGPEVYAAFHGSELIYQEVTSYAEPLIKEWEDLGKIRFDSHNPYFQKIEEMTRLALEACEGVCLVGYTDLHPGTDCAAAWRDPQQLCMDLICEPEWARKLIALAWSEFQSVYDHFDSLLKTHGQLSVTWMGIPSRGKMHIPSCDFAALISSQHFEEFFLPGIAAEVKPMTHNVFHLDGKGVAKNLDAILQLPEVQAIQWVQGVGDDRPIRQWLPLIRRIQAAGKSVVVDLQVSELEDFITNMKPEGIFLCIEAEESLQPDIIQRITKW